MFDIDNIHGSWKDFFDREIIQAELKYIYDRIGNNFTPSEENVLRFAKTNLSNIKVVILGQDPYPQKGVANGRSFQPSNLTDWSQEFPNVSLKNIIRNVYASYNSNVRQYCDIPSYEVIKTKIQSGEFNISKPKEWFTNLEQQGVLFLNSSLTTNVGSSDSHTKLWSDFSTEVIKYIHSSRPNVYWFIWGEKANNKICAIQTDNKFVSRHPMMCSQAYIKDFLKNPCFKETKHIINWLGC